MTPSEMEVHYRHVPTLEKKFARLGSIRACPAERTNIVRKLEKSQHKRKTSQPAASSADAFQKSDNIPAGKLVDELGLKKLRIGKARVLGGAWKFYCEHDGGATAAEMLELIAKISSDGSGKNWNYKPKCNRREEGERNERATKKDRGINGWTGFGTIRSRPLAVSTKALRSRGVEVFEKSMSAMKNF